jgi:hypothetical protein
VIKVSLDALPAAIRARARARMQAAVRAIQTTVATAGPYHVQQAIDAVRPLPVDRGTYRRSWRVQNIPGGCLLYNPTPYASVIERGRRAGKMPPPSVIGEWARRKGLLRGVARGELASAQRAVGFVIARAIARRGLPARRVLATALPKIMAAVRQAVSQALGEAG